MLETHAPPHDSDVEPIIFASALRNYEPRRGDEVEPPRVFFRPWMTWVLVAVVLGAIVFLFAVGASANAAGGCGGG